MSDPESADRALVDESVKEEQFNTDSILSGSPHIVA
jgi:hypothetical protein